MMRKERLNFYKKKEDKKYLGLTVDEEDTEAINYNSANVAWQE